MACQVIGPLSPAMWKLTASLRPQSSVLSGLRTNASATGSLHAAAPGAMVTLRLPPNVTGRLVPLTTAELPNCRPT